jgi:outer membrane protein OmpA-like peptidoglycan-associated protein
MEKNSDSTFQVIGYAAVFPEPPDPVALSLERANKVVSELVARKINVNKLQAVSGGETNRWGNNIDESGRAPNRRIVIQQRP